MGVERAVTQWYLHRQMILQEIAALEAKLAAQQSLGQEQELSSSHEQMNEDVLQQLEDAQVKLRKLGHCPKPMMG